MNNIATTWWIIAGVLVLLELLTGSFYLLMLALGAVLGALSAHAGFAPVTQWLIAALCSSAFVFVCYLLRRRLGGVRATGNPDVNLDIGEILMIDTWARDGSSRVHYRGAQWTAVLGSSLDPQQGQKTPTPGRYRVTDIVGNRLVVQKIETPQTV